ncbi:tryptophan--tRNA ligase [Candidatus Micrarchaeota archaeon CG10_big_fil_rev_8_21_14_0_10_54_18]|nr:MAG: tryptophan--tRNA ligase [Candidatus Micrarchaeota archaeon CG09_land_8_20_14_0_10_55_25]PJD01123.1 MAG: tryptophan--tRNA ligase [Candidatus Micrarchaeota archaeon CG10_big_fil_rev_8_21_14_0_10_54_18]
MVERIDPWSNELVRDYDELFEKFGLQRLPASLKKKFGESRLFRREILFAHRDYDEFVASAEKGEPVAVMSGIKPSSEFHLGSKLTAEEIIFNQKQFGAKAFYAVADNEALADNGLSYEESHPLAVDNVADLLALGFDSRNAFVYKQSRCLNVLNLAQLASRKVTMSTLDSLYGHKNLALYLAVLTQVGDVLQPQLEEFGGPKRVVVPVGVDQDPHLRLARDLAPKLGFIPPSSTYHRFFRALNGETKMSKRDPDSMLSLNDSAKDVQRKVSKAFTGGRATVEEQKKKGAEWWKCVVYELMFYHFYEDDEELKKMREDCESGKLMCGECKAIRIKKIQEYLKKHQEKKKRLRAKAEKLLE